MSLRYEHTKPTKQDDLPGPKASLLLPASATPQASTSGPEPVPTGPGDTADAQDKAQGLGAEDWVNAAEFVPGQPYCGRGKCLCVTVCLFVACVCLLMYTQS